jgi:hypothetical protein
MRRGLILNLHCCPARLLPNDVRARSETVAPHGVVEASAERCITCTHKVALPCRHVKRVQTAVGGVAGVGMIRLSGTSVPKT